MHRRFNNKIEEIKKDQRILLKHITSYLKQKGINIGTISIELYHENR